MPHLLTDAQSLHYAAVLINSGPAVTFKSRASGKRQSNQGVVQPVRGVLFR